MSPSRQDEYFNKPYRVECRHCHVKANGSEAFLTQSGWSLTRAGEVCAKCINHDTTVLNYEAAKQIGRAQFLCDQIDREPSRKLTRKERLDIQIPF